MNVGSKGWLTEEVLLWVYPPIEWVSKEGKNRKRQGRKGKGRDLCTQNNSPLILYILYNPIKSSLFLDRRH